MRTSVTTYLQQLLASLGESPILMAAAMASNAEASSNPQVPCFT